MQNRNVETFRAAHQSFNQREFDSVVRAMSDDVAYRDAARGLSFRGKGNFKEFLVSRQNSSS